MRTGGDNDPSVCIVLPTLDEEHRLPRVLASLAAQDYLGEVEILVVDGGSVDRTREIAIDSGAKVLDNPHRREEPARTIGIDATKAELVCFIDADNELPHSGWLARLVAALDLAPDVVSADCLYHEWRRSDPPVSRLCALIGGDDPLAIDLGYADRWSYHLGRWTGMKVTEEDAGDALIVGVDPAQPPPMGSNGYLVRREALLRTGYSPEFVHSDIVGDLAALGFRFARVKDGIVNHHATGLREYARKTRRRVGRTVTGEPAQRHGLQAPAARVAWLSLNALLLVRPVIQALRGYRRKPDPAWALYPIVYWITVATYAVRSLGQLATSRRLRPPGGRWR